MTGEYLGLKTVHFPCRLSSARYTPRHDSKEQLRPDTIATIKALRRAAVPSLPTSVTKQEQRVLLSDGEIKWRTSLRPGDLIDARDSEDLWYRAKVLDIKINVDGCEWIFVSYCEWEGDQYGKSGRRKVSNVNNWTQLYV